ncbi:MAG: extensin family protein, partial [Alphaproteobacteria bacterium]|nr:extensin family protein [Alphaproteobacteria bacterium]
ARDSACRYFNTVLGPEYNTAHADHFHLDLGKSRICR